MRKKVKPRAVRKFSKTFKKAIVSEYSKGEFSVGELCKIHNLHSTSIYSWIYEFGDIKKPKKVIIEMEKSSTKKLSDYEKKIGELERALGKKQVELDYYIKLIEVASDHYGEDLKKSLDIKP